MIIFKYYTLEVPGKKNKQLNNFKKITRSKTNTVE